jgi:hypothetical protein
MISFLRSAARRLVPLPVRQWLLPLLTASFLYMRSPTALARRLAQGTPYILFVSRPLTWLATRILALAVKRAPHFAEERLKHGELRTLWGVTPILTLPLKARADRALGFSSSSIVYTTYVITSQFDINLEKGYRIAAGLGLLAAFQRLVLAWAVCRYDVFHTFADQGLLNSSARLQIDPFELGVWHAAGKRIYIYAYGADVRTRTKTLALGRWNFCSDCTEPPKYCICIDAEGDKSIATMTKFATSLVSLGDMLTYMPTARCLNYWPIDLERIGRSVPVSGTGRLRIGHAPNHTHFKGSRYLEAVIKTLQQRGHSIDYVKVQGVPNTEVLKLFASCDLIADQFIGGAYGYTSLEAMALGRPVLSFVRDPAQLDAPEECPIVNATPDTLEEVLTWILRNRDKLPAIGDQGRRYVDRWHTIEAVASRLGTMYRETANFPPAILEKIEQQRLREIERREAIPQSEGWQHPYRVVSPLDASRRAV